MSDVEIIGRPKYRPVKHQSQEEQDSLVQLNSKQFQKSLTNRDIEYERDEKDWWWCEDV
jgi:hypothetical protein